MKGVHEPLNSEEKYLYGINVRLNILIEMFSSFLDEYAKEKEIATSNNEYNEVETEIDGQLEFDLDEEKEEEIDLFELTVPEIKDKLDELNVEYKTSDRKSDLIDKLRGE